MVSHAPTSTNLIFPSDWVLTSLRGVRDVLQAEGRDDLARTLSEVLGGLSVAPTPKFRPLAEVLAGRRIDDGGPDFELTADWRDDVPLDVLAMSLPPIAGGAPEPFVPSDQDWQDFADATEDRDWYREIDAQAAGLAI